MATPRPGELLQKASASVWTIAASALLPGLGQAYLGVDRALPYFGVEAFSWTSYVWHSRDSRRQRDAYRDLAAKVARSMFSVIQPTGDFEYYERMSHYAEAGRFEVVSGGLLDPEPDTSTYNGAVWLLAPHLPGRMSRARQHGVAGMKRATSFYTHRACDQLYRWSWGNSDEYQQFKHLIGSSNESNRRALQGLGVVIEPRPEHRGCVCHR